MMRIPRFVAPVTIAALGSLVVPFASAHPPSGIAADKSGQVFFVDRGRGVWKIDAAGKQTHVDDCNFHWLALDEEGRFLKVSSERFKRVSPDSSKPVVLMASDYPIAVGPDGCLYSAVTVGGPRVMRLSADGKESVLAGGVRGYADGKGAAAKFEDIHDMAIGPDGTICVSQASAVRKITPDGTVTTIGRDFEVRDGATDLPTAPMIRGLAVGPKGVLYAAATRSRCVIRITPDGKVATVLKAERPWVPTGVAVSGEDVFVLEYDDAEAEGSAGVRVRKVSADGKVTTLAALEKK